jgi:hypothetical protein
MAAPKLPAKKQPRDPVKAGAAAKKRGDDPRSVRYWQGFPAVFENTADWNKRQAGHQARAKSSKVAGSKSTRLIAK